MVRKAKRWDAMNKGNTPLEKLILQVEAFNRSEGKTEKTIEWYNHALHLFNDFLKHNGYSTLLQSLDIDVVRTYILHLQKRPKYYGHPYTPSQSAGLSARSVDNHVRDLKAFSTGCIVKDTPRNRFWKGSSCRRFPRY